jgi:hypothetical protein
MCVRDLIEGEVLSVLPSLQTPDQDRLARRRRDISFSQGDEWNPLMSKYIGTIPRSGEGWAAEQSISAGSPPRTPVCNAMIAKVGDAAKLIHSAARKVAPLLCIGLPSRPAEQAALMSSHPRRGSGMPPLPRPTPRPISGPGLHRRCSCRASSTTGRAESGNSLPARPPKSPGDRAA